MPVRPRATLVALYGHGKPAALRGLITSLQDRVADAVGDRFVPRPVADVHLTIVGLERDGIDVVGLCRHLEHELTAAPLTVRFGGVAEGDERVDGHGRRLFERALTAGPDKVALIGWPIGHDGGPTDRLDRIRRAAGRFGARHRYYDTPQSRDPDAYSVIGDLLPGVDAARLEEGARRCRSELARSTCRVSLSAADVRVATYLDPRLPAASTTSTSITDIVADGQA